MTDEATHENDQQISNDNGLKTPPPGAVPARLDESGKPTDEPAAEVPTSGAMPIADHPGAFRSLNDCLAIERTVLANERTFLAYLRTSLAVLVVAVTIIKFFQSQGMIIVGYCLLVVGVLCLTVGLWRFTDIYHKINDLGRCDGMKSK